MRSIVTAASLIRSLVLGTITTTATIGMVTSVVGCKDESQPEYWVDKLEDDKWRPTAIKRLAQFFEDAVTKAGSDHTKPEVTQLLDQVVEPLSKSYVDHYGDLNQKSRIALIKLIGSMKDPRSEPALIKAFEEFASSGRDGADDVRWAALAAGELKLEGTAPSMLAAFDKIRAGSKEGAKSYQDLNQAMVKMPNKAWVEPLLQKLVADIEKPNAKDTDSVADFKNQLFWQTTAAQILGEIGDASAVERLLKVMLDPHKADIQMTTIVALAKIGKPAVDRTVKLLNDEDKGLADFAAIKIKKATKKAPTGKPPIQTAALVLGTIGNSAAEIAMITALGKQEDESNKAVIARELAKLPHTAKSQAAFKAAVESISADTLIPPHRNALAVLSESAGMFFDSSMTPWLLETAGKVKGDSEMRRNAQVAMTVTAMKLMDKSQLSKVKRAVNRYGSKMEKDSFKLAEAMVTKCDKNLACYLDESEKSANQERKTQFAGIKAAYMVGTLGQAATADEVIKRLDGIENYAVRYVAGQAIDHLLPAGSGTVADALEKIIERNKKTADKKRIGADAPIKQVMYRVRSRAR